MPLTIMVDIYSGRNKAKFCKKSLEFIQMFVRNSNQRFVYA